jgi:uncharacterized protein
MVTRNQEINIWNNKIHTWQEFIDKENSVPISENKKTMIVSNLQESIDALKRKEYEHFSTLASNQHWRMYSTLKSKTCFLDIETTGLSKWHDDITLIGIHGPKGTKIFMNGKDLGKFENELKKYEMIVTFNGRCFDVPFIKSKFPDVKIDQFHADLRFIMADLGFRGGLKNVERERGIIRAKELKEVDGFEAVRLWHKYERGDNESLVLLKKYLTADVENLPILMNKAVVEMKQKHFFDLIRK